MTIKNVVCCGSNKYYDKIKALCDTLKDEERYIFILPQYCDKPKEEMTDDKYEELLWKHFNNLHEADLVVVFDYDGYIGHSTSIELGYARALNKYIIAIEEPDDESIRCMFDQIMHYNIPSNDSMTITEEEFENGLNFAYHNRKRYTKMYIVEEDW